MLWRIRYFITLEIIEKTLANYIPKNLQITKDSNEF